jgi:RimJ/RimL family protein N-acetyltransferase
MSLEEFHRLPFRPAWKQEYFRGRLVETPRQAVVHATIPITPRPMASPVPLRPAIAGDEQELLPCFVAAFKGAFEYCDYTRPMVVKSARACLHHFFQGPFHRWLPVSCVALGPPKTARAGKPIGAALVMAQEEDWALLDMIFVMPSLQRRGLATVLVAAVLEGLGQLGGYRTLVSRYHLGNEPSRDWHQRFGFAEEPDLQLAQLYLRAATHELTRLRQSGQLTAESEHQLENDRARWQTETDRLESLARNGHQDETNPWRKWRRKPNVPVK